MKLTEEQKSQLETLAVEVLLAVRASHLASSAASPLKHWEMLETRARSAARQSANAGEWATRLQRGMMVTSLTSSGSHSVTDLVQFCDDAGAHRELMRMVEAEHAVLMGLARLSAEARKEAREANAAMPTREEIESAKTKWLGNEQEDTDT